MPKFFISYRRQDNAAFVRRISDSFMHKYGQESIFIDFSRIPTGSDFESRIRLEIENCDILLAIIGPEWVNLLQEKTFDDTIDYVRMEIGYALELGKNVIPICILETSLPSERSIPPELRPMLKSQANFLKDDNHFFDNINHLINHIEMLNPHNILGLDLNLALRNLRELQFLLERLNSLVIDDTLFQDSTLEHDNDVHWLEKRLDELDCSIQNLVNTLKKNNLNVSPTTVKSWLDGKHNKFLPEPKPLLALANALEWSVLELIIAAGYDIEVPSELISMIKQYNNLAGFQKKLFAVTARQFLLVATNLNESETKEALQIDKALQIDE